MMPSRGLHLARGNAPRLYQLQCRQLSSASRRIPQAGHSNAFRSPLRSIQWQKSIAALPSAIIGIRHASTTEEVAKPAPPLTSSPQDAASTATTPPPTSTESTSFPNIDTISLNDIDLDPVAGLPETIGYLHSLGLNYGWGGTSIIEWTIEHFHVVVGLPWWGSFVATAIALRIFMVPFYIRTSDMQARQQALSSILKPVNERMRVAQKAGDQQGMLVAFQEQMAIRKRAGLSYAKMFTPMLLQGYFAYCGFRLLRAMVALPVPALKYEGPLWLHDLTLTDPYLILPLAMAGTIHLLIRMGGESGAQQTNAMSPGVQKFFLWGMPGLIVIIMGYQPAALCVWFAAGGAWGILQSLILKRPAVRQWLNIAPLYTPTEDEKSESLMSAMKPFGSRKAHSDAPIIDVTRRPVVDGKNAAFMNPTYQSPTYQSPMYQSPNLRRTTTNRPFKSRQDIVDLEATSISAIGSSSDTVISGQAPPTASADQEMIQPNNLPGGEGVASKAAASWQNLKKGEQDTVQPRQQPAPTRTQESQPPPRTQETTPSPRMQESTAPPRTQESRPPPRKKEAGTGSSKKKQKKKQGGKGR